jgi:putative phage-type endonuclease
MPLTKKQIEDRVNYLGGSDSAAILGLSRYKTPLSVWAIKTGAIVPDDISQEMPVKLGNMLEETVCKLFEEETGKVLLPVTETLFHPQYKFIGGNLDRRVQGERAFFEAKTTNSYKQSEWENEDEIPIEYQIQCHHYLIVTGLERAYIGCLIGNRKFVWRVIERNEKLLADMVAKEVAFWNNFIVPKVMPMTITSEDGGILYALFPKAAEESIVELDDKAQQICEIRDSSLADLKILEKQIDEYDNTLKAMLKTYEAGVTKTYRISWKNQSEKRLDVELLKKEEPAIYERYAKPKDKRVLRVAVKK